MGTNPNTHPTLILFLLLSLSATAAADDQSVMDAMAAALSPPPSGWSSGGDYCKWSGVNCDNNKRVTDINLASQSLNGTLPPSLNSLSQLQILSVQNNQLSGPLPSFANLTLLQTLFLDSNNFTSIPNGAFAGLTSLQKLSLSFNLNLAPWLFPSELTDSAGIVAIYASNVAVRG